MILAQLFWTAFKQGGFIIPTHEKSNVNVLGKSKAPVAGGS
jgi:hypothetical protein